MKKRFVVGNNQVKLPIASTILYSFLLWYFKPNPIFIGIFITIYVIYWILILVLFFQQKSVDISKFLEQIDKEKTKK